MYIGKRRICIVVVFILFGGGLVVGRCIGSIFYHYIPLHQAGKSATSPLPYPFLAPQGVQNRPTVVTLFGFFLFMIHSRCLIGRANPLHRAQKGWKQTGYNVPRGENNS